MACTRKLAPIWNQLCCHRNTVTAFRMWPRDRSTWNLAIVYSEPIFPLIWSNGLRKAKRQPPMVCASPKNSKKRITILCSCVHLFLKKSQSSANDYHHCWFEQRRNIQGGTHWSNDRIPLCKKCNWHKNINFRCAKCFLWWPTLNEPPNPCVQDRFYD